MQIALLDFPENLLDEKIQLNMAALEQGVFLSVAAGDLNGFSRNMAQLKPLYASSSRGERKCHVLGLNLMFLLVENRLSEFHAELELLAEEEAVSPYISFPIQLERQLMVGSYDEVLGANARIPDASYEFFMDSLSQTVRDSIADCVEVSYNSMRILDAMTMMKFGTKDELLEYIQDCRDDWIVEDDKLCFQAPPTGRMASDIPSMKSIAQSLSYATEMERIV